MGISKNIEARGGQGSQCSGAGRESRLMLRKGGGGALRKAKPP